MPAKIVSYGCDDPNCTGPTCGMVVTIRPGFIPRQNDTCPVCGDDLPSSPDDNNGYCAECEEEATTQ